MSSAIVSRSQQVYSGSQEITALLSTSDFWLDMADPNCFTLTNSYTIASLIDKSASPKSPLTISGTLRYDAITKGVVMNSNSFALPMTAPSTNPNLAAETIFIVAYQHAASATTYLNPVTSLSRQIRADPQGGRYTRVGSVPATPFNISPNYTQIFVCSFVYSNGFVTQYFNGVFNGTNNFTFGASPTSQTAANFQGTLFEMIIFNTNLNKNQIDMINKYLIDKWSVPTTGLISSPLSVSGCTLWLDGNDDSTIIYGSGTSVQQWSDKSGNSYHAIQNTGSKQPTYDSTVKGLLFSATNFSAMPTTAPFSRVETIFAVVSPNVPLGTILGNTSATRGREFLFAGGPTAGVQAVRLYADNVGAITTSANGPSFRTTDKYVISFVNSTAVNNAITTVNGIADSFRVTSINYTAGTFTNIVGSTTTATNIRNYNSYIYELILFNSDLSIDNQRAIINYLINKWNITVGPVAPRFPFFRTPVFSRFFNPLDIPNCSLWLDATDNTTLTSNVSGFVTQWRDKSGNNYHATGFGNTALQTLGNNRAIVFNNSNTYFFASNATAMNNTSNLSVIALGTFSTPPTANVNWLRMVSFGDPDFNANSNIVALGRFSNTNRLTIERTGTPASGTDISLDTPFIASSINTNTNINLFVNGTAGYSTSFATKGAFNYSLYNIGRFSGSGVGTAGNFVWSGLIGEVIAYNRYLNRYEREIVEGYLAQKWGLINNLPSTHAYRNLEPLTSVFNPLAFNAFCALWLDAGDGTSIQTSGGFVTQWNDKSGNGWHAVSIGTGPTYSSTTRSIDFTGAQNLRGAATQLHNDVTGNWSAFVVCSFSDLAGVPVVLNYDATPTRVAQFFRLNSGPNTMETIHFTSTGTATLINSTAAITTNTTVLAEAINTAANTSVFLNGANSTTTAHGTNIVTANNFYTVGVYQELSSTGVPGLYTGNYFSGKINEILVFRMDLTTVQRQLIEGYLAWKWGIQGSLASTHPYSKFPPI